MACSDIHVEVTVPIQETGKSVKKENLFTVFPIESGSILQTTSCNNQERRPSRATGPASAFLKLTPITPEKTKTARRTVIQASSA
jgi:hypothetical protein